MATKPMTNSSGVWKRGRPRHSDASQQKIWMPDGMAMTMLAAVKYSRPSAGSPVANMWWTQSPKPMKPVATSDITIAV